MSIKNILGKLLLVVCMAVPVSAQAQVTEQWVSRYNGPTTSSFDVASKVAVDAAGNVYVTGYSTGIGTNVENYDYVTIKYGPNGNELWVRRYNGPGNGSDSATALALDAAGNVYVTGSSTGIGTNSDYTTIKYDTHGNQLWVQRYNGPGNYSDSASALALDAVGNVVVTGSSWSLGGAYDYATIKYDTNGNQLWVQRYGGQYGDYASALALDAAGNVVVTGFSIGSSTNYDYATVKYDANGNQLWVQRYNGTGTGESYDIPAAIAVDAAGNVVVTGYTTGSGNYHDYATIKYDTNGIQLWVQRYNGPGNAHDDATALALDAVGNVVVTGSSWGNGTTYDYATIKYDALGTQLWVQRYSVSASCCEGASALALDARGNVVVTGHVRGGAYDYATLKYDTHGNPLWVQRYNGPVSNNDVASALAVDSAGNVYVTGYSYGSGNNADYATIKYTDTQTTNTTANVGDPIELAANYTFSIEQGAQKDFVVALTNLDNATRLVVAEVLNLPAGLSVTVSPSDPVTLGAGATQTISLHVNATGVAPGSYESQLKITDDQGTVVYATVNVIVVAAGAGDLPDLTTTAADMSYSALQPQVNAPVTISATVRNRGGRVTSNIKVSFYDAEILLGNITLSSFAANAMSVVSLPVTFTTSGIHLIRVVVDPDLAITELDEGNNEASQLLQVGSIGTVTGTIVLTGSLPITVTPNQLFNVSGHAVYEIIVNGQTNTGYVVKGAAVQLTVKHNVTNGQQWVYGSINTNTGGDFSKLLQAPTVLGDYTIVMTATDQTFTGERVLQFRVVEPAPPPPAPASTGGGTWTSTPSSGGTTWTWTWTTPPATMPPDDLWIYSEDIQFSKNNPAIGEQINLFTTVHFWAPRSDHVATQVPINFYVTYPGFPKIKVGSTVIDRLTIGDPNFGSVQLFTSWRNAAQGIYIVEAEIAPSYVESNLKNNAATRAIVVGDLPQGAISGHVRDADGAFAGVTIALLNINGTVIATTTTDSTGGYLFGDVAAGQKQVRITPPVGYGADAVNKTADVVMDTMVTVDFNLNQHSPPVAADQTVVTAEDTPVAVMLSANDPDGSALTYTVVTSPAHGALSGTAPNLTYTPAANFNGADRFTFNANDGRDNSNTATVTMTVNAVNDVPMAQPDAFTLYEDTALTVVTPGVLSNDSDIDGDNVTAVLSTGPAHGTVTVNNNGAFTYTPQTNYFGSDRFTYKAADSVAQSGAVAVTLTVNPVNDVPVVNAGPDVTFNEGDTFTGNGQFTDPDPDTWTATVDYGDASGSQAVTLTGKTFGLSRTYGDNGTFTVSTTVTDGLSSGSDALVVTVNNVAPTVGVTANVLSINEGQAISFSGSFTDPGADTHSYQWRFGDGATDALTMSPTHTYANNGSFTAELTVTDDDNSVGQQRVNVTVNNVPPLVGEISVTPTMVANIGTAMTISAPFTDPGIHDTHTVSINWGDGITGPGSVSETHGSGTATGSHTYTQAGVYTVTLTVTEVEDGGSGTSVYQFVVIYDPNGGFVTGGGWINSPTGAYLPNPSLVGKANFGFVSKYLPGKSTPSGQTEFQFKMASMNFHSEIYEWLVVSGARAQYKGIGTINQSGNYGFILTAIDGEIAGGGGTDKFRIKIWDKNNNDALVYDNHAGAGDDANPVTLVYGGQIKIHK